MTWEGVGTKMVETLYPGGTKSPENLDGAWVGMVVEGFKARYPEGSDRIGLDKRGVPMGAWLTTTFPVGIVVACGTIVAWAI
jgi:hypothetical protein